MAGTAPPHQSSSHPSGGGKSNTQSFNLQNSRTSIWEKGGSWSSSHVTLRHIWRMWSLVKKSSPYHLETFIRPGVPTTWCSMLQLNMYSAFWLHVNQWILLLKTLCPLSSHPCLSDKSISATSMQFSLLLGAEWEIGWTSHCCFEIHVFTWCYPFSTTLGS